MATLSKGYDLDYIWRQVDRGPVKDAAGYYLQASESGGEPPGYLRPRRDEMTDGDFIAAVAAEADVGILLDLHNAYANERNGRDAMAAFVAALPLERGVEIHVAGGLPHGRYWLGVHSGAMPDEVFSFARELAGSLPNLRVINFEFMPMYLARFGA